MFRRLPCKKGAEPEKRKGKDGARGTFLDQSKEGEEKGRWQSFDSAKGRERKGKD